jgi:hypothetical protein
LQRRSRVRHPHFEVAQAQGFDAASTLTAMDIEGIDVAVMYGTRGRQVLSHDNLPPDYAAALARVYNNWTHDYCAHNPMRLKFARSPADTEPMVRRLPGGGSWIRTFGFARDRLRCKACRLSADLSCGELRAMTVRRVVPRRIDHRIQFDRIHTFEHRQAKRRPLFSAATQLGLRSGGGSA